MNAKGEEDSSNEDLNISVLEEISLRRLSYKFVERSDSNTFSNEWCSSLIRQLSATRD